MSTTRFDSGHIATEDDTIAAQLAAGIDVAAVWIAANGTSVREDAATQDGGLSALFDSFDFAAVAKRTTASRRDLVDRSSSRIWDDTAEPPATSARALEGLAGWWVENPRHLTTVLLGADWNAHDRIHMVERADGAVVALLVTVVTQNAKGYPVLDAAALRTFPDAAAALDFATDTRRAMGAEIRSTNDDVFGEDFGVDDDDDDPFA